MTGWGRAAPELAVAALLGGLGYLAAGTLGLLIGVAAAAVAGVLALRVSMAPPAPPPPRRRPAPLEDAAFPRYRSIVSAVGWAAHSPRHFDRVLRPVLVQVAAARLADRHGIDLHARPADAARVLGPDVWPLVDPARPMSEDSRGRGVDAERLARAVSRLEQL